MFFFEEKKNRLFSSFDFFFWFFFIPFVFSDARHFSNAQIYRAKEGGTHTHTHRLYSSALSLGFRLSVMKRKRASSRICNLRLSDEFPVHMIKHMGSMHTNWVPPLSSQNRVNIWQIEPALERCVSKLTSANHVRAKKNNINNS